MTGQGEQNNPLQELMQRDNDFYLEYHKNLLALNPDFSRLLTQDVDLPLGSFIYPCRLKLNPEALYLSVQLHGSAPRGEGSALPVFARWNWGKILGAHVLSICDPTIYQDETLVIGWYLGNRRESAIHGIVAIAQRCAELIGLPEDHIIFSGGSGGGFAALQAAAVAKNGRAIAINAQTNLSQYHLPHVHNFIDKVSGCKSLPEAETVFAQRWNAIQSLQEAIARGNTPKVVLVQNRNEGHYLKHFTPFAEAFALNPREEQSRSDNFMSILYDGPNTHGPESAEVVKRINSEGIPFLVHRAFRASQLPERQQNNPSSAPLIICGTGRSGTSTFTRLIGCHPDIWAFRWESQLFSGIPGFGDLIAADFPPRLVKQFLLRVKNHLYKRRVNDSYDAGLFEIIAVEDLDLALAALTAGLTTQGSSETKLASCRAFIDAIFLPPMQKKGATIWCEKTPRNLLYAGSIEKIYPQAKFINVVRDGRDVIASMLKKNFWPVVRSTHYPITREFGGEITFEKVLTYWTTLIDIGLEQEKKVGPDRWLNVRLEDITCNFAETFDTILQFLQVDKPPELYPELQRIIKGNSGNTGRWRSAFSDEQVERFADVSRDNLLRFGYPLT